MDPMILSLLVASAPTPSSCRGGAPVIASAVSRVGKNDGGVNTYVVHVVVVNHGGTQKSNVLQSVAVYQNGDKVNEKGIPPLRAGASYAFDQTLQRSDESHSDATSLRFQVHAVANATGACYGGGAAYRLSV